MRARHWCLGWVLFALVCAQALGFMHRAAHLPDAADAVLGLSARADGHEEQRGSAHAWQTADSWLADLFAHGDAPDCRLFDGMGQCGPPSHGTPAAPPLPAALAAMRWLPAPFVNGAPAPFEARAPPVFR
jgi:hypothetical protein